MREIPETSKNYQVKALFLGSVKQLMSMIIPMVLVLVAFTLYYLVISRPMMKIWLPAVSAGHPRRIALQRLAGVFFLGILPLAWLLATKPFFPQTTGTGPISWSHTLPAILLLCPVMYLTGYLASHRSGNRKEYPQIRVNKWNGQLLLFNALSWAAYLLAYEFLFRGYLLFSLYEAGGYWPAVGINVGLYALVHLPKGWKETAGAIPFGLVICVLTLHTGNILTAFLAHLTMALSTEYFAIRANPDMQFVSKRRS